MPRLEAKQATVSFPGPLDMAGSLSFLSRNGDDYLDRRVEERWVRSLAAGPRNIPFSCRLLGTLNEPLLQVQVQDSKDLAEVEEAAKESFLLPGRGFGALLKRDPVLARLNKKFPGIRQVRQFDLFYGLLRTISAQQINLRWAATLRRRLAEAYGQKLFVGNDFVYGLRPEDLSKARVQDLRALQFSTHKSESVLAVAEVMSGGKLGLEKLAEMDDAEATKTLVNLRGIGPWSAEWVLVRCLGRSRVVAGDLGVRKSVAKAYMGQETASEEIVRRAVTHWGAQATTAQAILLYAFSLKAL